VATKLAIWNASLDELGHRPLVDTGEPVEAGRVLTRRYDRVVADCLSEASWNFAMETIEATADTGVTPEFGYTEVFAKPSDWVRTIGVSMDEYFTYPLLQYYDDVNFWSADQSPIYIRYVSNDTGLGMELTRWPAAFTRYVELELAHRAWRINNDKSLREEIGNMRDRARKAAKNQDAMNEAATKFPPPSSWTRSRWGDGGSGNDRGGRGSLTG
jgi:hypothetical protein